MFGWNEWWLCFFVFPFLLWWQFSRGERVVREMKCGTWIKLSRYFQWNMLWFWRFRSNIIIRSIEGQFITHSIGAEIEFIIEYEQLIIIESHSIWNKIRDSGKRALADALETNITITNIEFWWKNSTVSSLRWFEQMRIPFPVFISFLSFWGRFLFPLKNSLILRNTWTPSIQFNYVHSFHLNTLPSWRTRFCWTEFGWWNCCLG